MILFERESEDTHVTAGGTPWNYPVICLLGNFGTIKRHMRRLFF